ncbi:hypothetical protein GGI15_001477, partial [Coemansia interrupta]
SNDTKGKGKAVAFFNDEYETTYTSDGTYEAGCSSSAGLDLDITYAGTNTDDAEGSISDDDVASSCASVADSNDEACSEISDSSDFSIDFDGDVEFLSEPEIPVNAAAAPSDNLNVEMDTGSSNDYDEFEDVPLQNNSGLGDPGYFSEAEITNDWASEAWNNFGDGMETDGSDSDDDEFEDVPPQDDVELDDLEYLFQDETTGDATSMVQGSFHSDPDTSDRGNDVSEDGIDWVSFIDTINAELRSEAARAAAGSGGDNDNSDNISEVDSVVTTHEDIINTIATEERRSTMRLRSRSEHFLLSGPLRGVCCGSFGSDHSQSFIVFGPRHLSSWQAGLDVVQTDLSRWLQSSIIKKAAPLSQSIIGIIVDAQDRRHSDRDGELVLLNIDTALNRSATAHPVVPSPFDLPHRRGISCIQEMQTADDRTYFLTSAKNSTEVVMHSFLRDGSTPAISGAPRVMASHGSTISALGYDRNMATIVSGSVRGQITVADAYTGRFVRGFSLDEDDASRGLRINQLAFCPSNPNVLMASCDGRVNQLRVLDLRTPSSVVLKFGVGLVEKYPEEMKPAWNPRNGQVVAPYNQKHTGYPRDYLAIFDTRYINCNNDYITAMSPYSGGTWSLSFGVDQDTGGSIMVTAGDGGSVGVMDYDSYVDQQAGRRGQRHVDSFVMKDRADSYIVEEWGRNSLNYDNHYRYDSNYSYSGYYEDHYS